MSEKLKTFIIDSVGDFIINSGGEIILAPKEKNELYRIHMVINKESHKALLTKKELIKLFNLDLEVESEN